MGSWGHHGIQSPAFQVQWPGSSNFEPFTSKFSGWTPTEGHRYVVDIQLQPPSPFMADAPNYYNVINVISDEVINA